MMSVGARLKPAEGWTSVLLLTLMLLTVAWSIEAAQWADGLTILQAIVLLGVLVGLVLAESPVPGVVAHLLSVVVGAGTSLFLLGRQLDPAAITHTVVLDAAALTWQVRVTELVYRIQRFINILRTEGVGQDNFVFVLQMAVLMWLVAYLSTWFFFRMRSVWGAIVPSGIAILLNLYYAPPDLYTWMAVYLLAALLLIVQSNVFLQQSEWRRAGVTYAGDIGYDFLWQGAVFAVVVILLAWLTPTTSAAPRLYAFVDQFDQPVYEFQREFQRLYSSLNYRPQPGPAYFGDTMTLSGAVHLGDTPIFDAATDRGRYWRGVVYDQYTGRGWVNTATDVTTLEKDDDRLGALDFELRQPVTQTIRVLQPGVTQLHMLSQPVEVDVPARAQFSPVPTESGVTPLNVSTVQSRRPLKAGDMYVAVSSLSVADIQSLRQAGTAYPKWVTERYRQLPDELPDRVKALAADIAAGSDNPYDQVAALESYLRKIEYDESIPSPPPGVDTVDWFLFDEQAGYCDYYASSLVVMARSLGIPARMAAGYSIGAYVPEIQAYRQYEYDAHSWPEVFFPNYGWIEFEPTAADPEIVRPVAPATTQDGGEGAETGGANDPAQNRNLDEEILLGEERFGPDVGVFGFARQRQTRLWGLLALIGLSLTAVAAGWIYWRRTYRGLTPIGSLYARMTQLASWLGLPAAESQTPHEYAEELSGIATGGEAAVRQITDAYVLELYADATSSEEELSGLRQSWLALRGVLMKLVGVRMLRRIAGQQSRSS